MSGILTSWFAYFSSLDIYSEIQFTEVVVSKILYTSVLSN